MQTARTAIVDITPSVAGVLLSKNTDNRPVRDRYVKTLSRAMLRGEWRFNGDAIRVSKTEKLLDGQHRLMAVVMSGVAIRAVLISDLDDEVFSTIDRGAGRTTADTLAVRGEPNAKAIAAVTRLLHIYNVSGNPEHGNPDSAPTTQQQLDLLQRHPRIRASASWVCGAKWCRKYLPPALAAFLHYVFSQADGPTAASFFDKLESGVGLGEGSPILLLRNRLMESHSSKDKMDRAYTAALAFKAFKLYRDGATVRVLRVRTEGDSAEKDIFVL